MQYMLLIYSEEGRWEKMPREQQEAGMAAFNAYTDALRKAGALKASDRLKPTTTATTVHVANGKTHVQDGPFADSKERLGGYYLIDVADLDAAITWASRCPGAQFGKVEVRPVWAM
ncbi:MAG TPA: YciI family protein [Hyphomonadaceae bacterium]|nr:YciI family protein [Hyphomonadaceae bacterium]